METKATSRLKKYGVMDSFLFMEQHVACKSDPHHEGNFSRIKMYHYWQSADCLAHTLLVYIKTVDSVEGALWLTILCNLWDLGFAHENSVIVTEINELKSHSCAILSHCFSIYNIKQLFTSVSLVSGGYLPSREAARQISTTSHWIVTKYNLGYIFVSRFMCATWLPYRIIFRSPRCCSENIYACKHIKAGFCNLQCPAAKLRKPYKELILTYKLTK